MCGEAYLQSSRIAEQCEPLTPATEPTKKSLAETNLGSNVMPGGACPGWYINREPFLDVIRMVIDLKSRVIQCLTCNVPAASFLRVMHLVTGDYILIGPEHFENVHNSRTRDNELWYLSKQRGSKPVKLGQKMSEGAAISKKSLKIAFSQTSEQAPDLAPEASRLIVADLDLSGRPHLINQKTVYESKDRGCTLEAQDFYDDDRKMTFTCYEPEGRASVMSFCVLISWRFACAPAKVDSHLLLSFPPDGCGISQKRFRPQLHYSYLRSVCHGTRPRQTAAYCCVDDGEPLIRPHAGIAEGGESQH